MNRKKWTKEEVEFLKNNRENLTVKELATELNRTESSVTHKLKSLNLRVSSFWTKEEDDFLKENFLVLSYAEIAEKLNRSREAVAQHLKVLKLSRPKNPWTDEQIAYIRENYSKKGVEQLAQEVGHSVYSIRDIIRRNHIEKDKYWWSEKDIQFLRKHYLVMEYKDIGEIIGRSEQAIRTKLNQLGLTKVENWRKEEIDFLLDNYKDMSYEEIAEHLGRTTEAVGLKAKKIGLKKSPYHCDEDFFRLINTEEKAYWLGMLYADGYISINKKNCSGVLGMELQYGDIDHLHKFNKAMNSNFKIVDRWRPCTISKYDTKHHIACLRLYSKKLVNTLIDLNFVENKTYRAEYPIIDDNLFIPFLRGYFDGNGTISLCGRNLKFSVCSNNKDFLTYVQNKLKELFNFTSYIHWNTACWKLEMFRKAETFELYKMLYENSTIHLDRKYKKYLDYISQTKPRLKETTGLNNKSGKENGNPEMGIRMEVRSKKSDTCRA